MCGITGKIYHDREKNVSERDLHVTAECIKYRGPDGEGILNSYRQEAEGRYKTIFKRSAL